MSEAFLIDLLCMAVLGVLLPGMIRRKESEDRVCGRFVLLILAAMLFLALDGVCVLTEGRPLPAALPYIANLLAFLAVDLTGIAYIRFLSALMAKNGAKRTGLLSIAVALCLARAATVLSVAMTGSLFTIENGVCTESAFCCIPHGIIFILPVVLLIAVLVNRRSFTAHDRICTVAYLLLPLPLIVLKHSLALRSLSAAAITLPILLAFLLIQNAAIDRGRDRASSLEKLSVKDLLTGLDNRRAYYNLISNIEQEQSVGVLFCDLNGLKYTNDHFGHAAGDGLILRFSRLLEENFPEEKVFRISGDEFIVIAPGISEVQFRQRSDAFRLKLLDNDSIASLGCAFGLGCRVEYLLSEAEDEMYEDKRRYYLGKSETDLRGYYSAVRH